MRIDVGTSGYSYKDWVGPVYPPATAAKDFLKLYAERFLFTELNFSYYRQPDPHTIDRMAHVTGDRFRFAVKAHQSITHDLHSDLRASAQTFKAGISPLVESSKLAAVLLQFPYRFHYTPPARRRLAAVCAEFEGMPVAVEFRNAEWIRESVVEGLRRRRVALVNVDEPDLPNLIRPSATVTSHFAYVRFHGRNARNWHTGDNVSRYDYCYSDEELERWAARIQTMALDTQIVYVAFNNHSRGQAVQNANRLQQILRAAADRA
jgi:uncharacterized protein YecE (DUF72 family)